MTIQKLFIIIGILSLALSYYRYYMKKGAGFFLNFCQYFLGLLFIFSGFVKAIDPLGTSYKMHEYFESFARDGLAAMWDGLAHFSVSISIAMIVAEIVLGFAIILGYRMRWAAIGLLAINLFFLYLTGYSYLSGYCLTKQAILVPAVLLVILFLAAFVQDYKKRWKGLILISLIVLLYFLYCKMGGGCATCAFDKTKMKVTDCGCFGDFMKLKPWETFYKDIFLTIMSLYVVAFSHKLTNVLAEKRAGLFTWTSWAVATLFCLYSAYWGEPVVDFRHYAVGNDINEKMKEIRPRKADFIFIYKNSTTGEQKEFGMNNLPTDAAWTFVDRKETVIAEGEPAPINNLRFEDLEHNDVSYSILNEDAESYWVVCYDVSKTNMKAFDEKVIPFAKEMRKKGVNIYCMTGISTPEFDKKAGEYMDIVRADGTPLKTMIRSNPGLIKVKKGVVLEKLHYRSL
jgi:uncharacterized membrane protein YphA (DoxX/SURF4 family)